jgi:hypothetical protein
MRAPTPEQIAGMVDASTPPAGLARRIAAVVERERRAGSAIPDGFGTGGDGGGSGPGDPTPRAALARSQAADPHTDGVAAIVRGLAEIAEAMQVLRGRLEALEALSGPRKDPERCETTGCDGSAAREAAGRSGRCRRCVDWRAHHGDWPDAAIIDALARGDRTVARVLAQRARTA